MVKLDKIPEAAKSHRFKYGELRNIYDRKAEPVHTIMVQTRPPRGGWSPIGDSSGPFKYPTKDAAIEDLDKLIRWQEGDS